MLFPITIFPCVPFASDIFLINESAKTESSCPLVFLWVPLPFGSGIACSGIRTQKGLAALFEFLGAYLTGFQQYVLALGWVCGSVHTATAVWPLAPFRVRGPAVSRWYHTFLVLLSTVFCSGKREKREKTGHLSSFCPQILSTSGLMTPPQWFSNLIGLGSHLLRTQGWALPILLREDPLQVAPRQEYFWKFLRWFQCANKAKNRCLGDIPQHPAPRMQGIELGHTVEWMSANNCFHKTDKPCRDLAVRTGFSPCRCFLSATWGFESS